MLRVATMGGKLFGLWQGWKRVKRGAQRGVARKIQPCIVDVAEDRIWFMWHEHKFEIALCLDTLH